VLEACRDTHALAEIGRGVALPDAIVSPSFNNPIATERDGVVCACRNAYAWSEIRRRVTLAIVV
jgi:hypothetical protein